MEIRKLEFHDIEQLTFLRMEYQVEMSDFKFEEPEKKYNELKEETKKYLIDNLDKNIYFFGAFEDGKLVSICGLHVTKYIPQLDDILSNIGTICSVYTYKYYRGKGYQNKLLEMTLQFAKLMNIKRIYLTSKNPVAIKIYKKFGFEESDRHFVHNEK